MNYLKVQLSKPHKGLLVSIVTLISLLPIPKANCQQVDHLLWADLILDYAFNPTYMAEVEFAHHFILNNPDEPAFYEYSITPLLEIYPAPIIDVIVAVNNTWTRQTSNENTYELRPIVGFRLNFIQKGYILRSYQRLEYRRIKYLDSETISTNGRLRTRLELIYPLTTNNISTPKTLYTLVDAEFFGDIGETIDERYSNRRRLRLGLGWRFSRWHRLEFIYINQSSKNTIEGDFKTTEHIYRLRFKWLLHKKNQDQ